MWLFAPAVIGGKPFTSNTAYNNPNLLRGSILGAISF
jgi:hypothetical protein